MKPEWKKALELMELSAVGLDDEQHGETLMPVIAFYLQEDDLENARRVLGLIAPSYFDEHLPRHIHESVTINEALIRIVGAFGLEFRFLAQPTASA